MARAGTVLSPGGHSRCRRGAWIAGSELKIGKDTGGAAATAAIQLIVRAAQAVIGCLQIPTAMALSENDRTLYVLEYETGRLLAFDL